MTVLNEFLQKSAQLYKYLVEYMDDKETRSDVIQRINEMLNERGELVNRLRNEQFRYDEKNKMHVTLFELDKGIREKLDSIMGYVKEDLKELHQMKKNEIQYIDPYSQLRSSNSRYFDGKK